MMEISSTQYKVEASILKHQDKIVTQNRKFSSVQSIQKNLTLAQMER